MNNLTTTDKKGLQVFDLKSLTHEQKEVLKGTVAKHTSDEELSYFLTVAAAQDLNPFMKEVWCYKRAKKDQYGNYNYDNADMIIMTGRDGFLKMAKRHPNFKRIISSEVRENDEFTVDPISAEVQHRFETERGNIIGAYAMIEEKDGTKHFKYVRWGEYAAQSPIWKSKPTAMICKCAESVLCKQFMNVSGIVAEETITLDGGINSSPRIDQENSTLKEDLIMDIVSCDSIEELDEKSKDVAKKMGKLFEEEQKEVIEAGKKRRKELEFRNGSDSKQEVLDAEIVETKQTSIPVTT